MATISVGVTTRSHVAATSTTLAVAKARAATQAGLNIGLLDLVEARAAGRPEGRIGIAGDPLACRFGSEITLRIWIDDEAGKINLNLAEIALLQRLLEGAGLAGEAARDAATAIEDYRQAPGDDDRRSSAALLADGKREPKREPFDSIDELAQVGPVGAALAQRLRPLVTVHSDQRGVDPAFSPPELLAILAGAPASTLDRDTDAQTAAQRLGPLTTRSTRQTFTVRSEARIGTKVAVAEEMVVRLLTTRARSHQILAWRMVDASSPPPGSGLPAPDC